MLAIVQHELVEKKRWMTREEFVEDLLWMLCAGALLGWFGLV